MVTLEKLPTDILDEVLLKLPDFATLSAALRASKAYFYTVFQAHPKTTVLSIAYNLVGPALPQAVRVLLPTDDPHLCDEDSILADRALDRDACEELQQNAHIVQRLEDLFSLRNKDRSSVASRLSPDESFRFHRAVYRFWLYCERVSAEVYDSPAGYEQLLNSWATTELLEIDRVASFLKDVASWTFTSGSEWPQMWIRVPSSTHFMRGPACILSEWENEELPDDLTDRIFIVNFDTQLRGILSRRKVSENTQETERAKAIIDMAVAAQDCCHRCHAVKGVDLWGRPNWHLLRGFLSLPQMIRLLEGKLPNNSHEMSQLAEYIHGRDDDDKLTFDWVDFIEELCDMDTDAEGPWDKSQWYCLDCLLALIRLRLRKWWLATKVKDGMPINEDCWYGYNCRTQVHRATHAAKLNHLCDPTRGDSA